MSFWRRKNEVTYGNFVHAEFVLANIRRNRHLARDSWITLDVDWHFRYAVINVTDVIWMEAKVSQFSIFGECRHGETNVWRTHSARSNRWSSIGGTAHAGVPSCDPQLGAVVVVLGFDAQSSFVLKDVHAISKVEWNGDCCVIAFIIKFICWRQKMRR